MSQQNPQNSLTAQKILRVKRMSSVVSDCVLRGSVFDKVSAKRATKSSPRYIYQYFDTLFVNVCHFCRTIGNENIFHTTQT